MTKGCVACFTTPGIFSHFLVQMTEPELETGKEAPSQPCSVTRAPLKAVEFGLPATPLGVGSQLAGSYHVTLWSLTS